MTLTARPNGCEILEGVRSALTKHVLPALNPERDAVARNRLASALSLLAWLSAHWDGQADALSREVLALEELLESGARALDGAGLASEAGRLAVLAAATEEALTLTALARRSDSLQDGLVELLSLVDEDGPAEALVAVRERAYAELTALVRRRLA